jgi:hypothetical protein
MNSLTVTEIIARSIENGCKEMVRKSIMMCGERYGFDGVEALKWLEIDNVKLERKVMRRSKGKKNKEKEIPMPFEKEMISREKCSGLRYNNGLYTQCEHDHDKSEVYCKSCLKEGKSNGTGKPDNGCIEDRLSVDLMEFKDPKGRSPKEYYKVLKKLNISEEEAKLEAGKKNYIINNIHFEKEKKEKKEKISEKEKEGESKKGRPKKEKKEVHLEPIKDIFAELVEDSIVKEEVVTEVLNIKKTKKEKKVDFVENEKVSTPRLPKKKSIKVKEMVLEGESEAEAEALVLKLAEEKKAKEEAEALALKLAEEKKAKEAEALAEAKALAEAEAANKLSEGGVPQKKVTVTRFEFEGKKYLKSSENILYDADTKEEMGIWCEDSKSIKALPEDEDDEEEEEEEYDE